MAPWMYMCINAAAINDVGHETSTTKGNYFKDKFSHSEYISDLLKGVFNLCSQRGAVILQKPC